MRLYYYELAFRRVLLPIYFIHNVIHRVIHIVSKIIMEQSGVKGRPKGYL